MVVQGKGERSRIFCTCSKGSYADCSHAQTLSELHGRLVEKAASDDIYGHFGKSVLIRLFKPLFSRAPVSIESVRCKIEKKNDRSFVRMEHRNGDFFGEFSGTSDEIERFVSRLGEPLPNRNVSRHELLLKAREFVLTDHERQLLNMGHRTARLVEESSLWHRLAYHCYRECLATDPEIIPYIDSDSGEFRLIITMPLSESRLQVVIPRSVVAEIVMALLREFPQQQKISFVKERDLLFRLKPGQNEATALIVPVVEASTEPDEGPRYIEIEAHLLFGHLVYIPHEKAFVQFAESNRSHLACGWVERKEIRRDELSGFLEQNENIFSIQDTAVVNEAGAIDLFGTSEKKGNGTFDRLVGIPFITRFDTIEINPSILERDWCWIAAEYKAGDCKVQLADIFEARERSRRFIVTPEGLVDCSSKDLTKQLPTVTTERKGGEIRLSRAQLLQFNTSGSFRVVVKGQKRTKGILEKLLDLSPARPLKPLKGLSSNLREYQAIGLQWLLFLYDNRFGGLLCDDMGLGKTHQVLAMIVAIREQRTKKGVVLVVCPTTVISHWYRIIQTYASDLRVGIFHGSGRDYDIVDTTYDILLTSYGIVRNDIDHLKKIRFNVAVFDEIHYLKNPDTSSCRAAKHLKAKVKIGMTGTPVENGVTDIKTLFDIVLPGLLGTDDDFRTRFSGVDNRNEFHARLRHIIRPFMLRRTKEKVITELPAKIEDLRFCELSEEQVKLYHQAIQCRASKLVRTLEDESKSIPYMHIFSLLNFLKEICNHPALASGESHDFEKYESGKWDLFKELLQESLDSGQKVVVFTQYLGMIDVMRRYLENNDIGHVTFKGSTTNRGAVVERFNTDPDCRVFVGSLKAGGIGIDLIAASVVIHYDRWWNAAREDQATDRVHRMGQKKVVQVFKLVTAGTLEEKIAALIEQKRTLAQSIVVDDSADGMKAFNREELLEFLKDVR